MTPIHNIVVATDFSPGSNAAVDRAVLLAQTHGASLRLLHAFDVSAWHSLQGVFDPHRLAREPPPDVQIRRRLTEVAASLAAQTGLQVEDRFTVGKAASAISAYVNAHDTALLVIGSRPEPGLLGLGSTASRLLRSPTCPVLTVRWGHARPYAKVLAAVDLGADAMRAATFAVAVFPAAQHHLVLALAPALERAAWLQALAQEQLAGPDDSMRAQALRQLEQLALTLTRQTQHPVIAEVLEDSPARAILERAAALPADCVAVSHHGQGAGAERLLGSMAQQVLQHTLRDVLVVP